MYSGFSSPDAVRGLARHQIEYYEARIAAIEEALLTSGHDAHRRRYLRTGARLALHLACVLLDFWRDVEQDPDRKSEAKRRGVGTAV